MNETAREQKKAELQQRLDDSGVVTESAIAIRPGQGRFSEVQLAALRQLGIEDASDGDLDLFFHVCKTSGLDPFRKQIYMIARKTKVNVREISPDTGNERTVERYVDKYTIQVGIGGFRKRAREIADGLGVEVRFSEPLWCGHNDLIEQPDGTIVTRWREVFPDSEIPLAAKFTTWRDGVPFTFIAHYSEYVQTYRKDGQDLPNSMWTKSPRNMIRKVAETNSIQAAFPDELGDLILEGTAQDVMIVDQDGAPAAKSGTEPRRGGAGLDGIRDRQREIEAEAAPPPDETPQESQLRKSARAKLDGQIFSLFGKVQLADDKHRDDRMIVIRKLVYRTPEQPPILSSKDLSDDERQALANNLKTLDDAKLLDGKVREWLNEADLADMDSESAAAAAEADEAQS